MKKFRLLTLTLLLATPFLTFAKMQIIPLTKTPDGHMEIHASINNVEAKFILDTGATGTVIDINQLKVFGITKGQDKIDGVGVGDAETGKIETFPVDINQFSIGKNQLNIKSVYANDSSGQFASDVMGLIGYDALFELNALLDVKKAELLIPENRQDIQVFLSHSTSTAYQTVSLHKSPMGFSFVDALIKNKPVRLLVDSGAPELILDESSLLELGLTLENHPTAKSVIAEGVELPMKVLKNGRVVIADVTLSADFFTTDFTALMNAVNVQNQPPLIGILGNKHLEQMNSIIDVAKGKIYIKP